MLQAQHQCPIFRFSLIITHFTDETTETQQVKQIHSLCHALMLDLTVYRAVCLLFRRSCEMVLTFCRPWQAAPESME